VVTTQSLSYTRSDVTSVTLESTDAAVPAGLPTSGQILGRADGENFRVASWLLPPATRGHLLAVYGFARLVDHLGDEYDGDRPAALAWLSSHTELAVDDPAQTGLHPLVARAAASVRAVDADPRCLQDLIAANRQDQLVDRYATFDDLVGYCRLSADPIGRLVLAIFDAATTARLRWSDRICTGLQLAEHWQDVAEDAAAGRVYLPTEDLDRFGVTIDDLHPDAPGSPALRALMAFEVARARRILDQGVPLVDSLGGRARWAVAGFWAGGQAALDAIAAQRFDPRHGAPRPTPSRVALHMGLALRGRHGRERR
jgi:squalene synthase HpnC